MVGPGTGVEAGPGRRSGMRQLHRIQRGSVHWPFIIALLLLLAFVYMWFAEKDQKDQALAQTAEAKAKEEKAIKVATDFVTYARDLSAVLGWQTKAAVDVVQDAEAKVIANTIASTSYFTDVAKVKAQLARDGTNDDGTPGLLNYLITQAELQIRADLRTKGAGEVSATEVNFEWPSEAMRKKVQEINQMPVPRKPVPPIDADDEADVARYESEMKAYEAAVQAWMKALDELQAMEGYKKYADVIKGPGTWDPDTQKLVKLEMMTEDPTGSVVLADLISYPPKVIERFKAELRENKTEDTAVIDRVRSDNVAKEDTINDLQRQLAEEQQRHTADVDQLRGELATANETAERNRQDATTAMNDLTREKEDKVQAVADRETKITALENRVRVDKEVRDLQVRRDDPDGRVLSSSPQMRTAIIDLGSRDKVYPGQKFAVSRIGRGGVRYVKGQVQVVEVLGPSSAKVSILAQADPRDPVIGGDLISNPFYAPGEQIHLFIVGELQKYPREVLLSRLAPLNVIVDKEVSGDTDYIVVRDDLAAPAAAPAEGEEGGEEAAAPGAQTEFDRVATLARTFGATLITERLLNQFLGL